MATFLPSSGALALNANIHSVFGRGNNINAYRGTTWHKANSTSGTFPSGALNIGDFYDKGPTPAWSQTFSGTTGWITSPGDAFLIIRFQFLNTGFTSLVGTGLSGSQTSWTFDNKTWLGSTGAGAGNPYYIKFGTPVKVLGEIDATPQVWSAQRGATYSQQAALNTYHQMNENLRLVFSAEDFCGVDSAYTVEVKISNNGSDSGLLFTGSFYERMENGPCGGIPP